VLRTPSEDIWPGVSELPDYKATFPKWNEFSLHKQVPRLADNSDGMELLKEMLIYDPSDRISSKAAIIHPFFNDFDKKGLPIFDDDLA